MVRRVGARLWSDEKHARRDAYIAYAPSGAASEVPDAARRPAAHNTKRHNTPGPEMRPRHDTESAGFNIKKLWAAQRRHGDASGARNV